MLDKDKYKELMEEDAPSPWKVYYAKAISALRLACSNINEDDEDVELAIAMQIQYTFEYQDDFVTTRSLSVGEFSTSAGGTDGKVSPYNIDAINLLMSKGKCSIWRNHCNRCGCDDEI